MKRRRCIISLALLISALAVLVFWGCKKKGEASEEDQSKHRYAPVSMVGNSFNLFTFPDFAESKPSLIKDKTLSMEDPKYFEVNKELVPYEVNLWEKAGRVLPMPASSGRAASASIVVGDNVYFGEHTLSGVGFYRYDRKAGKGQEKPSVTMPAVPYLVLDMQ